MAAYVARARIERVAPRLVSTRLRLEIEPVRGRDPEAPSVILTQPGDELPSPAPSLMERLAAARERWGQLTFYVFDADSWR